MNNNFPAVLGGTMSILFGAHTILHPKFYSTKFQCTLDFTNTKWYVGMPFIIGGITIILFTSKTTSVLIRKNLICPNCEEVYPIIASPEEKCHNCNIELEELKGFYERHPEKKIASRMR